MSSVNPYQTPESSASPLESISDREELRRIASAQRQVNVAVLVYILMFPASYLIVEFGDSLPFLRLGFLVMVFFAFCFTVVSVYRLAAILQGPVVGVVHCLALLVPLLGIILLLVNSHKATKILQRQGVRVGLFGANPRSIKA